MSDFSPYQTPMPQPTAFPSLPVAKPAVANVFGILHLVFAGIGLVGTAWGLFIAVAGNPFLKLGHSPEIQAQMEAQLQFQDKTQPMTLATSILSLLVAVPMIIAGIRLLKGRKNAIRWSNGYAWFSLFAKVVGIGLTLAVMLPAMKEMTDGIMGKSGAPAGADKLISGFAIGGAIGGMVVSCVYPFLSLILLNFKPVKAWFAAQSV